MVAAIERPKDHVSNIRGHRCTEKVCNIQNRMQMYRKAREPNRCTTTHSSPGFHPQFPGKGTEPNQVSNNDATVEVRKQKR